MKEMRSLEIRLPNSYGKFILTLIRQKQHLRNCLILLYEETKDFRFLRYDIVRALVFDTKGGKKEDDVNDVRSKYGDLLKKFNLKQFDYFSSKIVEEIAKELDANYKTCFKLLKQGNIDSFNMHAKKLASCKKGSLTIPYEVILSPKDGNNIRATVYSKKHSKDIRFQYRINEEISNAYKHKKLMSIL